MWAAAWLREPAAAGVQRHVRRHAGVKAAPVMRMLATAAQGMVALVVGGLDERTEPGQPAAPPRRPGRVARARGPAGGGRQRHAPPVAASGGAWALAGLIKRRHHFHAAKKPSGSPDHTPSEANAGEPAA